jgi:glyoxylase-like metal-dependent hydrolase (beta-lactamase superfamily II)
VSPGASPPVPPAAPAGGPATAWQPGGGGAREALASLGLSVIERGWLSANQAVFRAHGATPATVVDTGYATHAAQTLALVDHALAGEPLGRIVNTHLHSDHCGGNAALQARAADEGVSLDTWIPQASLAAVRAWDESALSYRYTGQQCDRFAVDAALVPGGTVDLGAGRWQVHAAPGHDMDAVMLFEPQTRTLIAGDALWHDRLAIIFPELVGEDGWGPTRATLDLIARLSPRLVIPGHGPAFEDVDAALAASRQRLDAFERQPGKHVQHATRALVMYHLLEVRHMTTDALVQWMLDTPVFSGVAQRAGLDVAGAAGWAREVVEGLVAQGVLEATGAEVGVPAGAT